MNKDLILFTSDCFSEDRNASLIAVELKKIINENKLNYEIAGASLVSEGNDYKKRGIDVIVSTPLPPSGGFSLNSIKGFFADLFSGSFSIPFKFVKKIRNISSRVKIAVVVGDIFLLWLTSKALKNTNVPILFYIHSKTDYIEPHYKIEEKIMNKVASAIFARDELTANNLKNKGLPAYYFGSVIMDELVSKNVSFPIDYSMPTIGILPGTRGEAYDNFLLILEVVEKINKHSHGKANYVAALVPSFSKDKLIEKLKKMKGWDYRENHPYDILSKGDLKIILARGLFVDVVDASDLLIGLSGAGNEQAAGLGKPVVAFVGKGPQTTKKRFSDQQKLMGESLIFVRYKKDVPLTVISLLNDKDELKRRGKIGMERMGESGGASRIADFIAKNYLM